MNAQPTAVRTLRLDASHPGPAELVLAAGSRFSIQVDEGISSSVLVRTGDDGAAPDAARASGLDVSVGRGADLHLILASSGPGSAAGGSASRARVEEGGRLRWTEAVLAAADGRWELDVDLAGRGAELDFAGAYAAAGRESREHRVVERHLAPATRSRAVQKSVLRGESRLRFSGMIKVAPEAAGTDAYLQNRNLLLDDGARAESLPQLDIETDEVACSHGSATGGPREEEVFYLMSRGLDRNEARGMLAAGHLGSVLDRLPEDLRAELAAAAEARP